MAWTTALGLPPAWFTGWTADANNITLPLASMAEITQTEAAATVTGDIRKVMYAILENMWVKWNIMALADRPAKMVMTKSSSVDAATGVITTAYTYTFKNTITSQDVAAE
jgi:hypothetical protein